MGGGWPTVPATGKTIQIMRTILTLIRWKNLAMIAITMVMMRYAIIAPLLEKEGFSLQLPDSRFWLLVMTVLCIAAGGYIINDVMDTRADAVNRPETVVVGKKISSSQATFLYAGLNVVALFTGVHLSYHIGLPRLSLLFLLIMGLLWFYSNTYKWQLLLGNVIIALLVATVPLVVYWFEIPPVHIHYRNQIIITGHGTGEVWRWIVFYSVFAFLLTLLREIIKDAEDFAGDRYVGKNTLPFTFGIKVTKYVTAGLLCFILVLFMGVDLYFIDNPVSFVYITSLLILPMGYLLYRLVKASTPVDFHHVSTGCKWVMVAGIGYSVLVRFFITHGV